jgi:hypothetical protein
MQPLSSTDRRLQLIAWIILALALAFSALVRWRLADFPLERDEGEFAYAGQLILQGIPPYQLASNMKLPGTYLAYAGMMAVFGQTTAGIHFGLLAVNLLTITLIFFFARNLFDPMTAAVAAAAYAVLSCSPSVLGMAAHATHFVAFFGVAGAWALWRAIRLDRLPLFLAGGCLLGIAFLMKQHSVFLLCFGALATAAFCLQRPIVSRRHVPICLLYAAGAVLPYAAICLWLWRAGTFDNFWFWTVQYAREYVNQMPLHAALLAFWWNVQYVVGVNWPLWALAAGGAFTLARDSRDRGRRAFLFAFLGFLFLCVMPGFYFRNHYFIAFLPGVAIFAGVGGIALVGVALRVSPTRAATADFPASASRRLRSRRQENPVPRIDRSASINRGLLLGMTALVAFASMAFPVWQDRDFYFFWPPDKACRRIYELNPFVECPVIADYLRTHSNPQDRVAVLGSEPEIYFYANRHSATTFMYTYPLMESHPFVRAQQEQMIDEITSAKPEFLVSVTVPTSWSYQANSDRHILEWMNEYTSAHYRPVGLAEILSMTKTEYHWGAEAAACQPRSQFLVWLLKRK